MIDQEKKNKKKENRKLAKKKNILLDVLTIYQNKMFNKPIFTFIFHCNNNNEILI